MVSVNFMALPTYLAWERCCKQEGAGEEQQKLSQRSMAYLRGEGVKGTGWPRGSCDSPLVLVQCRLQAELLVWNIV